MKNSEVSAGWVKTGLRFLCYNNYVAQEWVLSLVNEILIYWEKGWIDPVSLALMCNRNKFAVECVECTLVSDAYSEEEIEQTWKKTYVHNKDCS